MHRAKGLVDVRECCYVVIAHVKSHPGAAGQNVEPIAKPSLVDLAGFRGSLRVYVPVVENQDRVAT
jgi:hypothetical protein